MNWLALIPYAAIAAAIAVAGVQTIRLDRCQLAAERAKTDSLLHQAEVVDAARRESAAAVDRLSTSLADLTSKKEEAVERIVHVPVTTDCSKSPAMRIATDSVHRIIGPAPDGKAPAGRGPAAAVPGPAAGPRGR